MKGAKAFALVMAGLIERQIRTWKQQTVPKQKAGRRLVRDYLVGCAAVVDLNLTEERLHDTLIKHFLVANGYRHGDGASVDQVRDHVPQLWPHGGLRYIDLLAPAARRHHTLCDRQHSMLGYGGQTAYVCSERPFRLNWG